MRSRRLAAAGLDVLAQEPPRRDNPLLMLEQVIFSPLLGGLTGQSVERMASAAVQNFLVLLGRRLDRALAVNPTVLHG